MMMIGPQQAGEEVMLSTSYRHVFKTRLLSQWHSRHHTCYVGELLAADLLLQVLPAGVHKVTPLRCACCCLPGGVARIIVLIVVQMHHPVQTASQVAGKHAARLRVGRGGQKASG